MASNTTTYKDVVNIFRTICSDHKSIKYFALGEVSDIETPTESSPSGIYPYVFLNPTDSQIGTSSVTYNFNLIVCDLAKDQEDLETRIHNNTLMIIQDILAYFRLTTRAENNMTLTLPVNAVWFVEKYKGSVAGWSVAISVNVISPLNICETAFTTLPV